MRALRQICAVGNTLGVTLPKDLLEVYELHFGSMVEIRPIETGVLIQPVIVVSPLSPARRPLESAVARRYIRALDAMEED